MEGVDNDGEDRKGSLHHWRGRWGWSVPHGRYNWGEWRWRRHSEPQGIVEVSKGVPGQGCWLKPRL